MIAANLGIATLIPICWVLMAIVHQVRPRWLSSVQPRLRWRYLLICAAVALVVLNAVTLIPLALGSTESRWRRRPGSGASWLVIVLTSPLQAAAEEIFFRGYLMQALGSLVAHPAFGVVVSALIFALMHGVQNPALFLNRLGFGLLAGVLVWRTGGLEAGIGAHVVNNICAYVIAGLTSSIAAVRGISSISWLDSGIQLGGFALFAVLALLIARRMRLRTTGWTCRSGADRGRVLARCPSTEMNQHFQRRRPDAALVWRERARSTNIAPRARGRARLVGAVRRWGMG